MTKSADNPFKPVKFAHRSRGQGRFITFDRSKRAMLSAQALDELIISDMLSRWIVVYYDKASQRIAVQKEELVSAAPDYATTKVDKRGYFNARPIIEAAAIEESRLPVRFYYEGAVSIGGERFHSFALRDE